MSHYFGYNFEKTDDNDVGIVGSYVFIEFKLQRRQEKKKKKF